MSCYKTYGRATYGIYNYKHAPIISPNSSPSLSTDVSSPRQISQGRRSRTAGSAPPNSLSEGELHKEVHKSENQRIVPAKVEE